MVYTTFTIGCCFGVVSIISSNLMSPFLWTQCLTPCFFLKVFSLPKPAFPFHKNPSGEVPVGESNLTVPVETHRGNYSHFMIYTRSSSTAIVGFQPGVQGLLAAGEFLGFS